MKNLKLLSVFLIAMIFSNCNNDDDKTGTTTLNGSWKLIETSGTIAGTTDTFAPGTITWNFNDADSTFTVVNNNTDQDALDIFDSGAYPFTIVQAPIANSICNEFLELDGTDYGCFYITNNTLQTNEGSADGIILKFTR